MSKRKETLATPTCKKPKQEKRITLSELVETIEDELETGDATPLYKKKRIEAALQQFSGDLKELNRFAFFDKEKKYTRNLIATDNKTYALMLLCWNKGKFSPIHDHPCNGCWAKIIDGQVQEIRYQQEKGAQHLIETQNVIASEGVMYMHDCMGLHKVGNPSDEVDAITLHLYSPPYEKCRVWFDENNADKSSEAVSCYYSEFGKKVEY